MAAYAENTKVDADASLAEIKRTLKRFGADQFASGEEASQAIIGFRHAGRFYRLRLPLLQPRDVKNPPKNQYKSYTAKEFSEKENARRWRSLALFVKAIVVAVEDGIITFETVFQWATMLPDGQTVGDYMEPQIAHVYETGSMPALLPGLSSMPALEGRK